jgi:hypothetical protein
VVCHQLASELIGGSTNFTRHRRHAFASSRRTGWIQDGASLVVGGAFA